MRMATASKKHWTIDMVRALPDDRNRYEIIDGELLVTRAPSLRHQRVLLELALSLAPYLKVQRLGTAIVAPADVEVGVDTMVEPDLFVIPPVSGPLPGSWTEGDRLLLVVEVLSPSTARTDRVRKRALYAQLRVPEYWIVDIDARVVERWRPDDARPEILDRVLEWSPAGCRDALVIDLDKLFGVDASE
jgi:Uma2 family endonuclease